MAVATDAFAKILERVERLERLNEAKSGAERFANPMIAAGDIIVGGASGAPGRMAKGANSRVFGVDSAGNLGYHQVTSAMIADGNVTTVKLQDLSVNTGKIADVTVTTAKLAANAVTTRYARANAGTNPVSVGAIGATAFTDPVLYVTVPTGGGDILVWACGDYNDNPGNAIVTYYVAVYGITGWTYICESAAPGAAGRFAMSGFFPFIGVPAGTWQIGMAHSSNANTITHLAAGRSMMAIVVMR